MPHCIVEYSSIITESLPIEQITHAVFKGAHQSELFIASDIKVRAIPYEHVYLPGSEKVFVHVNLKILSGRDLAQRKRLSASVISQLERLGIEEASVTVQVSEIESESYEKTLTIVC